MQIISIKTENNLSLPLFNHVQAGFPSPAENEDVQSIDLNKYLIKHPAATFFVKVAGDSMIDKGIMEGDLAVVDRSLIAKNGSVIIAFLNSQFTIKEYWNVNKKIILKAANPKYPNIIIKEGDEFEIWGVVSSVIHIL